MMCVRTLKGSTSTYMREDHLVDVTNLDQSRLFRDEEDITFKEEGIALNGFEMGFETWALVKTTAADIERY